jgi:DNA-binding NarL/FixJ family response regulator
MTELSQTRSELRSLAADDRFAVLLVDDVAELRLLLRLSLESSDRFAVIAEAGDGAEGVAMAGRYQPDLVLLDISMPVQNGLESLPLIREASPRSRIVMLSAFEEWRLGAEALALGAYAYLEKGQPPERLVARLVDLMDDGVTP